MFPDPSTNTNNAEDNLLPMFPDPNAKEFFSRIHVIEYEAKRKANASAQQQQQLQVVAQSQQQPYSNNHNANHSANAYYNNYALNSPEQSYHPSRMMDDTRQPQSSSHNDGGHNHYGHGGEDSDQYQHQGHARDNDNDNGNETNTHQIMKQLRQAIKMRTRYDHANPQGQGASEDTNDTNDYEFWDTQLKRLNREFVKLQTSDDDDNNVNNEKAARKKRQPSMTKKQNEKNQSQLSPSRNKMTTTTSKTHTSAIIGDAVPIKSTNKQKSKPNKTQKQVYKKIKVVSPQNLNEGETFRVAKGDEQYVITVVRSLAYVITLRCVVLRCVVLCRVAGTYCTVLSHTVQYQNHHSASSVNSIHCIGESLSHTFII
jgi:hypothetical protein